MTAYYNEFDPFAAAWLRNLIAAGHIAPGDVDERSILEVSADDLKSYTQCHFFAGIGGWSYAARLAGWPDDRPLWTGSCPCQPYSAAGKRAGTQDERDLWPALFRLIEGRRPHVIMGEQVADAIGFDWLARVCSDLENADYDIGAAVIPACAVNAPHRRDRLWFVADTDKPSQGERYRERGGLIAGPRRDPQDRDGGYGALADAISEAGQWRGVQGSGQGSGPHRCGLSGEFAGRGESGDVADADMSSAERQPSIGGPSTGKQEGMAPGRSRAYAGNVADAIGDGRREGRDDHAEHDRAIPASTDACAMGLAIGEGLEGSAGNGVGRHQPGRHGTGPHGSIAAASRRPWDGAEWLIGADGKARRVEPGIRLLAHGVPARMGKLRGYGNAIVPQVAAEVMRAYMEIAAP